MAVRAAAAGAWPASGRWEGAIGVISGVPVMNSAATAASTAGVAGADALVVVSESGLGTADADEVDGGSDDGDAAGVKDVDARSWGVDPAAGSSSSSVRSMTKGSWAGAVVVICLGGVGATSATFGDDNGDGDDADDDDVTDGAGPTPGVAPALARSNMEGSSRRLGWSFMPMLWSPLSSLIIGNCAWEMLMESGEGSEGATAAKNKEIGQESFEHPN